MTFCILISVFHDFRPGFQCQIIVFPQFCFGFLGAFQVFIQIPCNDGSYDGCHYQKNDDRDQVARSEIKSAIKEGRRARVVIRNYRKDGVLFWNELSITPIFNDKDQLTYFIGMQRDVSELVRLKEENNALKTQLAKIGATLSQNSVPTA